VRRVVNEEWIVVREQSRERERAVTESLKGKD